MQTCALFHLVLCKNVLNSSFTDKNVHSCPPVVLQANFPPYKKKPFIGKSDIKQTFARETTSPQYNAVAVYGFSYWRFAINNGATKILVLTRKKACNKGPKKEHSKPIPYK